MKTIVQLENEYKELVSSFKEALKKAEKDEKVRVEARKLAQRSLGAAIEIRRRYEELSVEKEEFVTNCQAYDRQVTKWQEQLERLGSPMSGIPNTTFDDIAGLDEVKEAIKNYLFALKNPEVAKAYNISTNVGMLMYGPPGTGKTLIAEAIAHELGVRFFVITPSSIFGSYVGESERNVRDIFAELRACEDGAVLLVDECESIFGKRTGETNRAAIGVANQLLQEMNGAGDGGTGRRVIIGATNMPENIDEAYLRYKRFSMQFFIDMPSDEARLKVIDMKLSKLPHEESVREAMIEKLDGTYTCADISGIIEQCAYRAMEEYRKTCEGKRGKHEPVKINLSHFDEVLRGFSKSVTPELIAKYRAFHAARTKK